VRLGRVRGGGGVDWLVGGAMKCATCGRGIPPQWSNDKATEIAEHDKALLTRERNAIAESMEDFASLSSLDERTRGILRAAAMGIRKRGRYS
jgi:hypothetical protein